MELITKLAAERRARLAAERKLELKQAELEAVNRRLAKSSGQFTEQIAQKRAEMEQVLDENFRVKTDLTVANKRVQIAERRLWDSIETIEGGFAVFDRESTLVIANSAYLEIFDGLDVVGPGIAYADVLTLLMEEGIADPEDLDPRDWRSMMLERWADGARAPKAIRTWEDRYLRLIDERTADGETVSLVIDITESVLRQKELEAAQIRAEEASRTKSAFLANMSHEIRTPMNGVVGMAELLSESALDTDQHLYVDTIRNSAEALLVIINDVLDYSKLEAQRMVLHPEPFDLERCLHEVLLLLQPACREKGITLDLDFDLFMPTRVVGDQGRIRQIMTNLIGNAVKFTPEGGVQVRVTGVPPASGELCRLHISVEDTGIGIPEHLVPEVFGEFNQVEDARSRRFEGTGLGLSITRRLVDMMEGQIWVESELGLGSTFGVELELPVEPAASPELRPLPIGMDRVMVIDARTSSRVIAARQLAQLGLHVEEAAEIGPAITEPSVILLCQTSADDEWPDLEAKLEKAGLTAPVILETDRPAPPHGPKAVLRPPVSRADLLAALYDLAPASSAPLRFSSVRAAPRQNLQPLQPDRQMRLLLAEDNRTNRLVFTKMIAGLDLDIAYAETGREAVDQVAMSPPDIIFMDVSMPEMDGKEAARLIRETGAGAVIPIIAVTAHATEEEAEEILAAGMTHCLTKPLRKSELVEMIRRYAPTEVRSPFAEPLPASA
ncbi:hypothetical protein SAMN05421688_2076 [Poseidonocella pacifica]|uniref:histidine kinase n=1 Tax=Poseidonocella pacifica TaxID=871651 RepID=A0A1I0XBZ4_9RHOB|nr:ATP-binding protein [Poseidonocella pacifica]SFA98207.1 hypothetical protein SAMN05421688_2076 [Poseidonocella pacifica]